LLALIYFLFITCVSLPVYGCSNCDWCSQLNLSSALQGCLQAFFSVAVQSLKDFGRLTYRRFLELFRHMVGFLGRVISPSQGPYLHRTTQHRKTRTNIHALSGIRTHDPSNQPAKSHASDSTATVTGADRLTNSKYKEK
jgi:hypothetical protein